MGKNFGMVRAGRAPEALGEVFKNDVKKWGAHREGAYSEA